MATDDNCFAKAKLHRTTTAPFHSRQHRLPGEIRLPPISPGLYHFQHPAGWHQRVEGAPEMLTPPCGNMVGVDSASLGKRRHPCPSAQQSQFYWKARALTASRQPSQQLCVSSSHVENGNKITLSSPGQGATCAGSGTPVLDQE